MIKNPIMRNILSAVVVVAFGFILLNLTFMFFALVTKFFELFLPFNLVPISGLIAGSMIITVLSWFIFRSKLGTIYKAIYMTVPVAVVLALIGILFYRWSWLSITLGGLFSVSILIYLIRARKSWLYSLSLILVSLVLLIMTLLGIDI
ncbi:MAG: hypothetical protein QME41_04600 [Actinomycetota bacterium]|nr:hypothetical protein [Actinomycetota bacterium]